MAYTAFRHQNSNIRIQPFETRQVFAFYFKIQFVPQRTQSLYCKDQLVNVVRKIIAVYNENH